MKVKSQNNSNKKRNFHKNLFQPLYNRSNRAFWLLVDSKNNSKLNFYLFLKGLRRRIEHLSECYKFLLILDIAIIDKTNKMLAESLQYYHFILILPYHLVSRPLKIFELN